MGSPLEEIMTYHYSDPSRESDAHALPNVEVFKHPSDYLLGSTEERGPSPKPGWYWAAGFPGCLWDSDPVGPFDTEAEALEDARS